MTSNVAQLVATVTASTGAAQTRAAARLMTYLESHPQRLPELFQAEKESGQVVKWPRDPAKEEESGLVAQWPSGQVTGEDRGRKKESANSELSAHSATRPLDHSTTSHWPEPRMVLGITGSPGAGKSTMTDALVAEYRYRFPERKIGVIAVDPSSPFTGGAVLGDRVRMMRHATDPMVFVRSLATRGHLGGLSLGVRGVLHVLALIGCEIVIIETVGVGQSEVEIAQVADLTAILFAPGQGDSIQLLKAGLMEIGDLFIVNKADRQGADELYAQLMSVLKLGMIDQQHDCGPHHGLGLPRERIEDEPGKTAEIGLMRSGSRGMPEVHLVSAAERRGIPELVTALEKLCDQHGARWQAKRRNRIAEEIRDAILEEARQRVDAALGSNGTMGSQVQRVLAGELTIEQLAGELLQKAGTRDT